MIGSDEGSRDHGYRGRAFAGGDPEPMVEMSDRRGVRRREAVAAMIAGSLSVVGCLGNPDTAAGRTEEAQTTESRTTGPTTTAEPRRVGLGPETFERLSDLEVDGGELYANDERHVTGTQCAELHTGSDGAWLHVPLDEPIDFSNARIACSIAMTGTAAGKFPYLDLQDVHGNRFRLRAVVRSDDEPVRVDFGVQNPQVDDVAVDLERVNRISFRPGPTDESGTEVVYLDNPVRVATPETPKVVFMFDDGNETDYTEALPYLSQYGYPAITYVNTDTIGADGRLDEAQLGELAAEGWLIGSHTTDHSNLHGLESPEQIEAKVAGAKQWLVERGFTDGARHFAYPYNGIDRQALEIVSKYHDTGRVAGFQPIALPSNPQLLPADGEADVDDARQLLDDAVQFGGVISLYYHNLADDDSLHRFQRVVDEIRERERAGEIEVVRIDRLEEITRTALSEA
jgi:peptidoglycan/xylan/chitin deacetylase (PgdA/CDA1 family)